MPAAVSCKIGAPASVVPCYETHGAGRRAAVSCRTWPQALAPHAVRCRREKSALGIQREDETRAWDGRGRFCVLGPAALPVAGATHVSCPLCHAYAHAVWSKTVNRFASISLLRGPAAVATGLGVLLASGVLVSLVAARILSPGHYTIFAAFFGLFGVLVLAPATSLEQESVLRGPSGESSARMLRRALLVWLVVTVVVVIPVVDWQQRLLGAESTYALVALVLGAPVVLALAVLRGLALGAGKFGTVAAGHLVAGLGTLVLPLALYASGLPAVMAFILGAAFAWVPALVLVLLRTSSPSTSRRTGHTVRGATLWLVAVNLLVLFNLSVVPPVLRWHVIELGAASVADTQLLVSISRLATTAVLAALPLVLGTLRVTGPSRRLPFPTSPLALAAALGLVSTVVTGLLGRQMVELLTGRESALQVSTCFLAALPTLLLCPAIVLMAVAISRGAFASTCAAWALGALLLLATGASDPGSRIDLLLAGVAAAAATPLVVLAVLLAAPASGRLTRRRRSAPPRRGGS